MQPIDLNPDESKVITVPFKKQIDPSHEYFVNVSFSHSEDYLWANAGGEVATKQFALSNRPALAAVTYLNIERLRTEKTVDAFTITGKNNSASFNPQTGILV